MVDAFPNDDKCPLLSYVACYDAKSQVTHVAQLRRTSNSAGQFVYVIDFPFVDLVMRCQAATLKDVVFEFSVRASVRSLIPLVGPSVLLHASPFSATRSKSWPLVSIGQVKSFGLFGPKYETGKVLRQLDDGDWMIEVTVIESGEKVEYRLSQMDNDPEAR